MQQVQISDKGAIVCYMYFNPYYLATAPISKYPLHQSTHTFVLTTFLCCWVRLWFLLKLTFSIVYIITIQSLVKTKLKVFRSYISMLYKVYKIHAVMYRCIILVINSALFCILHVLYIFFMRSNLRRQTISNDPLSDWQKIGLITLS